MAKSAARKQRENEKKEKKKAARARADRFVTMNFPDGRKAVVDLKNNPLAAIYRKGEIEAPQWMAGIRFYNDYITSKSTVRSASLSDKVDGGGVNKIANMSAVEASLRLGAMRKEIGEESFLLLQAVVGEQITTSQKIEAAGGDSRKTVGKLLKEALHKAAVFYELQREVPVSRTVKVLREMLAEMLVEAGEHPSLA